MRLIDGPKPWALEPTGMPAGLGADHRRRRAVRAAGAVALSYLAEPARRRRNDLASVWRRNVVDPDHDVWGLLTDYDVVSFDLFDTLVTRPFARPEDVHVLVGETVRDRAHEVPDDWLSLRVRAERNARDTAVRPDVTLHEIYAGLRHLISSPTLEELERTEIEVEISIARPMRRGRILWDAARRLGSTLVVTSDMYLPRQALERILASCGYSGWQQLVVSGDDGLSKRDGSSFRRLLEEYPKAGMIHIGDDHEADLRAPLASGIAAKQILPPAAASAARSRRVNEAPRTWHSSLIGGLGQAWEEGQDHEVSATERIGYSVLGPVLVGFSQYLHLRALHEGVDSLVFLAREGKILRRAYCGLWGDEALPTSYALVSTRALGIAGLGATPTPTDLAFLTKTPVPLSAVEHVCRFLGYEARADVTAAIRERGLDPDRMMSDVQARDALPEVFAALWERFTALRASSAPVMEAYLRDLGVDGRGTAIVDVGWQGSLQAAMCRSVGGPRRGFYLATRDNERTRASPGVHAWVDERLGGADAVIFDALWRRVPVIEVLLATPDYGSVQNVRASPSGFEFEHLPNEFGRSAQVAIETIQRAAMRFVNDYACDHDSLPEQLRNLPRADALAPLLELLVTPAPSQIAALSGITFDGSYGVSPSTLGHWWIPVTGRDLRRRLDAVRDRRRGGSNQP